MPPSKTVETQVDRPPIERLSADGLPASRISTFWSNDRSLGSSSCMASSASRWGTSVVRLKGLRFEISLDDDARGVSDSMNFADSDGVFNGDLCSVGVGEPSGADGFVKRLGSVRRPDDVVLRSRSGS